MVQIYYNGPRRSGGMSTEIQLYGEKKDPSITVEIDCSGQSNGEFFKYTVGNSKKGLRTLVRSEGGKRRVIEQFPKGTPNATVYAALARIASICAPQDQQEQVRKDLESHLGI
jgi:hypothetical protein